MKKVLDNIIYIVGVIAAILFLIFKDNTKVVLIGMGVFSLIISILLILKKNNLAVVFSIVAVMFCISLLLYYKFKFPITKIIPLFLLGSFFFILIYSIINYKLILDNGIKVHKLEIEGTIVDLVKNPNVSGNVLLPIVRYSINGEDFEVNYYRSFLDKDAPGLGTKVIVNVNPNDYYDVYYKPSNGEVIKNFATNIVLALITLFILWDILL